MPKGKKKKVAADEVIPVSLIRYTLSKPIANKHAEKLRMEIAACVKSPKIFLRNLGPVKVWYTPKEKIKHWIHDNHKLFMLQQVCKELGKTLDIEVAHMDPSEEYWIRRKKISKGLYLEVDGWNVVEDTSVEGDETAVTNGNKKGWFPSPTKMIVWIMIIFVVVNVLFSKAEFRVPEHTKCLKSHYQHKEGLRCFDECSCVGTRMCSVWGYCHIPTQVQLCTLSRTVSLDSKLLSTYTSELGLKDPCPGDETTTSSKYYFSGNVSLW